LILFYNEKAYAGIVSNSSKLTIYKNAKDSLIVPNKIGKHFHVKLQNLENHLNISVSKDGKIWNSMMEDVDVSELHHNKYKGFYALRIALIAAGNGAVKFNNFIYNSPTVSNGSNNSNLKDGVIAPRPVFRDPVYDGAADPMVIWNPLVSKWWMFYTNRRATMTNLPGVSWVFGSPIGIAESADGANWKYVGTGNFNDLPSECGGKDSATLWAPDIVLGDDGKWHMYLSVVPGIDVKWGLPGFIAHLTSSNLRDWKYQSRLSQLGTRVIDADILRMPDGIWRMYYKDQTGYSHINVTESKDLYFWSTPKEALKIRGEGPIAFQWKGYYWLVIDTWNGQTVHRSKNGNTWEVQPGSPLMPDGEGTGKDDIPNALHANVVISDDRLYMYYFTHPGRIGADKNKDSFEQRRTSIQVVELRMNDARWLTANRNEPTYVKLSKP
jgi:beta-xylosidase